jgi:hypothetical protein
LLGFSIVAAVNSRFVVEVDVVAHMAAEGKQSRCGRCDSIGTVPKRILRPVLRIRDVYLGFRI